MRIQPIYLLIDSSGSMNGEPINSVNKALRRLLTALRKDPQALEVVSLSIITFDREVKELFPLTPIVEVKLEDIIPPLSGGAHMGEALQYFIKKYNLDIKSNKLQGINFLLPTVFVVTEGKISDLQLFDEMVIELKNIRTISITGFRVGLNTKTDFLNKFADAVYSLQAANSSMFTAYSDIWGEMIEAPIKSSNF